MTDFIDLTKVSNDIKLKVTPNGDGTFSLDTTGGGGGSGGGVASSVTLKDGVGSTLATIDANGLDVDVVRLPTLANVTTLGTITNTVHVDDNAGSLTIDGSLTGITNPVTISGSLNTVNTITNVVHIDDNSGSLTVDGNLTSIGSITNPVTVSGTVGLSAGENHLGAVGGSIIVSSGTLTRPGDTNAYAINDVVSDSTSAPSLITFLNLARVEGGSGYLMKAKLLTNRSTDTEQFRLHLYHTPVSGINDNAQFTLLWNNITSRVGYLDFPALSTEGTGSNSSDALLAPGNTNFPLPFKCAAGSKNIYGILETKSIFTPASGQMFYIELTADVN